MSIDDTGVVHDSGDNADRAAALDTGQVSEQEAYHAWQRANEAPTVYSEVPMIPGEHEEATISSGNSDAPEPPDPTEAEQIELLRAQVAGFEQTWQGQEAELQRLRVENLTLRIRLDMINELYQAEQEKRRD